MKKKAFKDMTVNEHGNVFLNTWYFFFNTKKKNEIFEGWFDTPDFKSRSLAVKTESLVKGDRLMDKMEKLKKCLSF